MRTVSSEECLSRKFRGSSRDDCLRVPNTNHDSDSGSDSLDLVTGNNESPNTVPEFITGQIPSQTTVKQPARDQHDLFNTTCLQQNNPPVDVKDPITRLAEVLTNIQNRPTAQQHFTIRPVNFNSMISDGNREKFELFEDLFHTMITMQPEMSEQIKITHFQTLFRK